MASELQRFAAMSAGIWAAASGAVAQISALDVAANNVANATTPGFRSDQAVFRLHLQEVQGNNATRSLRYATTNTLEPNFETGQITQTGRPLDVAIKGDGFFVVSTPQGERYTRAGNVQIRGDGTLTTREGDPYLGPARRPISVPAGAQSVSIARDGSIVVDGEEAGGKLFVVNFASLEGLEKEGNVLLRATPAAGRPIAVDPDLAESALEQSNASAMKGMSGLMSATRSFEMLSRVIEAFSEADRRAATDLMKRG